VRYLPDQKQNFGYLSNCSYCADRPRNLPKTPKFSQQCADRLTVIQSPNFIQIGSLSAELIAERVNTVFCPVEYFHNSLEAVLRFGRMITVVVLVVVIEAGLTDLFQRTSFMAVAFRHSGDWLLALPIASCGLKPDDEAVRVALGLTTTFTSHISVHAERKSMLAAHTVLSANRHRANHIGTGVQPRLKS